MTTATAAPYELVDFAALPGTPCPCGTARRAFTDVEDYPGTIHVTEIALDNQLHYHKRLTETYYFLECEPGAQMQLDSEVLDVRPGTDSAVYASVSGSLLALQNKFITPDVAGFMHSIEMVTMAVLGGAGSVLGAILGAAILTALPQVLTVFQEYEQLLLGLVMMLVMIFMREGLLPSIARRIRGRAE